MDAFLLFFERMPDWQKVVWVMACLGVSWLLEGTFPLLQLPYRKWRHAGVSSAFGGVLSIWDHIFGTFVYGDPREVRYGLDVSDTSRDEDVGYQFKLPFTQKERLTRE